MHRETRGLHEAAYLLGLFAFLSQILALVRDRLLAASFGAGSALDAYFAAFRIPDLILISAASLVSASILIPLLVAREREDTAHAKAFVDSVFSAFFAGIVVISAVAFFLAPRLVPLFFPGFTESLATETILLTRIMLLQPILLGVSNLFGSILQTKGRFFVYAVSPLLYNLGIIVGVVFLEPLLGLSGLAWGVVLGALLHALVQVPSVARTKLLPRFTFRMQWRELKHISLLSLPRTASLAAGNIASLVLLSLASSVGAGSVAIFTLASNMQSVPLAIVGVSYSFAAFPTLVRLSAMTHASAFTASVSTAFRSIVFWSLPATALFIVLRAQMVRVVLGAGEFSWADTRLTAAALALFAVSLVAQALALLLLRAHYASGRTARPFFASALAAITTVALGVGLLTLFRAHPPFAFFIEALLRVTDVPGTAALALPLAFSLGAFLHTGLLWAVLGESARGLWRSVYSTLFESFAAATLAGAAAYGGLNLLDNFLNLQKTAGVFLHGFLAGLLGLAAWIAVLYTLKSRELASVWATVHQKIWRLHPVSPDPADTPTL